MDLAMPDILVSITIGLAGFAVFRYGKKASRTPHFVAGVALMASTYLVTGVTAMLATGGVILAGLWLAIHYGH